ncbi:TIGR01777 family oxidoreductase [Daejeonella oryzae]|uniref:TIGR01777 family oxidoreductase n=1 Tax=Daejeonella oryzae TaxID=1122943 RepID=UPI0003F6F099|nr:TIGR01777 family oxidoreductase [Daejeonella oryzae]
MSKTILLTGGTGLIGKPLSRFLLQQGHRLHHLSRNPEPHGNPRIKVFKWDVYNKQIDETCIDGVDIIIHLAGEGIAEKRWTANRKKKIIESRTESIRLIYNLLKQKQNHQVKTVISASAIGFYGDRDDELLNEDSSAGNDFLAHSCIDWENAVDEGSDLGLRIVKFRTGVVLAAEGGALPEMDKPVKAGFGAGLGDGKQWVSWIHHSDALRLYGFAVENENLEGVYNMVAPNPVTNNHLMLSIASALNKKIRIPNVPAFALKLLMGEMSVIVLGSAKVSSKKIESAGFQFNFNTVEAALKDIYSEE